MTTPYQMAINNMARKIRSQSEDQEPRLNAFDASIYLAVAFCKLPEDVIADIISVNPGTKS